MTNFAALSGDGNFSFWAKCSPAGRQPIGKQLIDWLIDWSIDWLIDWIGFYAVLLNIFEPTAIINKQWSVVKCWIFYGGRQEPTVQQYVPKGLISLTRKGGTSLVPYLKKFKKEIKSCVSRIPTRIHLNIAYQVLFVCLLMAIEQLELFNVFHLMWQWLTLYNGQDPWHSHLLPNLAVGLSVPV